MEEGSLFALFVAHVEISQTRVPLVGLLDTLWESPSMSRGAPSWFDNVSP